MSRTKIVPGEPKDLSTPELWANSRYYLRRSRIQWTCFGGMILGGFGAAIAETGPGKGAGDMALGLIIAGAGVIGAVIGPVESVREQQMFEREIEAREQAEKAVVPNRELSERNVKVLAHLSLVNEHAEVGQNA